MRRQRGVGLGVQLSQLPGCIAVLLPLFFILEKAGRKNPEILSSACIEERGRFGVVTHSNM